MAHPAASHFLVFLLRCFHVCRYNFLVFIIFPYFFSFNPDTIILLSTVTVGGLARQLQQPLCNRLRRLRRNHHYFLLYFRRFILHHYCHILFVFNFVIIFLFFIFLYFFHHHHHHHHHHHVSLILVVEFQHFSDFPQFLYADYETTTRMCHGCFLPFLY